MVYGRILSVRVPVVFELDVDENVESVALAKAGAEYRVRELLRAMDTIYQVVGGEAGAGFEQLPAKAVVVDGEGVEEEV